MLTLFGNLDSGNAHKVQMILKFRDLEFRRVNVRQDLGHPRDDRFLKICSMGKIPAVMLDDGDVLTESGALLYYFAQNTPYWPTDARSQAEVLRWMFFEQYSHEPAIAVLRYLKRFAHPKDVSAARITELEARSIFVLDVLEQGLKSKAWITGGMPTIADLALYPYTRLADEVGLNVQSRWQSISDWLDRLQQISGFLPVYSDGAAQVAEFNEYFSG